MTGNDVSGVLDIEAAFEKGFREVAELTKDTQGNAEQDDIVPEQPGKKRELGGGDRENNTEDSAESAGPGLVGADAGGELPLSEKATECIGEGIVQHGAGQEEEDPPATGVGVRRSKRRGWIKRMKEGKRAEKPADINSAGGREGCGSKGLFRGARHENEKEEGDRVDEQQGEQGRENVHGSKADRYADGDSEQGDEDAIPRKITSEGNGAEFETGEGGQQNDKSDEGQRRRQNNQGENWRKDYDRRYDAQGEI